MSKVEYEKIEYEVKIAKGFESKFKNFVAEKKKLVLECKVVDSNTFVMRFENGVLYEEFFAAVSNLVDVISVKRTDVDDESNSSYYAVGGIAANSEINVGAKFSEYALKNSVIEDVYVPILESEVWVDQNTQKTVRSCMSPGYVYVKSTHKEFIAQAARDMNIRVNVLGIVSNREIEDLKKREMEDCNLDKKNSYSIGDRVQICDGPFKGYVGRIEEIDEKDNDKFLRIILSALGREVPVKLAFSEVRKV